MPSSTAQAMVLLVPVSNTVTTTTDQLTWDTNLVADRARRCLRLHLWTIGHSGRRGQAATSTPTYMAYNSSGSTWVTTNEAGDLTGFWGYDAFGTLAFGTPTSPFGYGGQ